MAIAMTAFPSIDLVRTGKRIETVRKDRGLSVRDIQEYFGFEYPQAVYKWQHGECLPTVDNLFALARLLRVNMEDLLVAVGSEDQEVPLFYLNRSRQNLVPIRSGVLPASASFCCISFCPGRRGRWGSCRSSCPAGRRGILSGSACFFFPVGCIFPYRIPPFCLGTSSLEVPRRE